MLESDASKHLKMKNAGWMGWVASFCGPASIGCAKMLAGFAKSFEQHSEHASNNEAASAALRLLIV